MSAQVSAEIRWFRESASPPGLEAWFLSGDVHGGIAAGGGVTPRTDLYRRAGGQTELAIKARGNKPGHEIKGLVATLSPLASAPFVGAVELWSKWSVTGLAFDRSELVATDKLRWIRKFDTETARPVEVPIGPDESVLPTHSTPKRGCQLELTRITVEGATWWSLGFESFGSVATVERDLRETAALVAKRNPPSLGAGMCASYPAWLERLLTA